MQGQGRRGQGGGAQPYPWQECFVQHLAQVMEDSEPGDQCQGDGGPSGVGGQEEIDWEQEPSRAGRVPRVFWHPCANWGQEPVCQEGKATWLCKGWVSLLICFTFAASSLGHPKNFGVWITQLKICLWSKIWLCTNFWVYRLEFDNFPRTARKGPKL